MKSAPTQIEAQPGSLVLWETWYQAAVEKLEAVDVVRFQLFTTGGVDRNQEVWSLAGDAQDWLREAIELARELPDSVPRVVTAQARYAWASYLRHEKSDAYECALASLSGGLEELLTSSGSGARNGEARLCLAQCRLILGDVAYLNGEWEKALHWMEGAVDVYSIMNLQNLDVVFLHQRLGICNAATGDLANAILHFQSALTMSQQISANRERQLRLLGVLVEYLVLDGQYRRARGKYSLWGEITNSLAGGIAAVAEEQVQGDLAFFRCFMALGDRHRAAECVSRAEKVLNSICPPPSNLMLQVGMCLAEWDRYRGQLGTAEQRLCTIANLEMTEPLLDARLRTVRAEVKFDSGHLKEAEQLFSQACEILHDIEIGRHTELPRAQLGLCKIDIHRSKIVRAKEFTETVFETLEDQGRFPQFESIQAMHLLGMAYLRENHLQKSGPLLKRAEQLLRTTAENAHFEWPCFLLTLAERAVIDGRRGLESEPETGLYYCHLVEQWIAANAPCHWRLVGQLRAIQGQLQHVTGHLNTAMNLYQNAVGAWNQLECQLQHEHPEKGWVLTLLASLHVRCKFYEEATTLWDTALPLLLEQKETRQQVAYELNRLGNIYFRQQLYVESQWFYLQAELLYIADLGKGHAFTQQAKENRELSEQSIRDLQPTENH